MNAVSGQTELMELGFWRSRFRKISEYMVSRCWRRSSKKCDDGRRCMECGQFYNEKDGQGSCPTCQSGSYMVRGPHKDPPTSFLGETVRVG